MKPCPLCGKRLVTMLYNNQVCEDPACGTTPTALTLPAEEFVIAYTYEYRDDLFGQQKDPGAVWLNLAYLRKISLQIGADWSIYRIRIAKTHLLQYDPPSQTHKYRITTGARAEYLELVP